MRMGQPGELLLNGLLSNESTRVICVLNAERWLRVEERTTELIACIQPNGPSEERRNAVADYVQRLIMKCFPCQVFTFGSVPLKTYLPDGDIDLTVFSNNPNLKDTWATLVRDILESEEKNESAEFCVKEVQYIQAEVKIIKCLVENIVVDISFNQLGGLCTLCFLEEVDHLINQNHLFKRSIILIKAWCYYESRILGAHHGLISTYALETLVLYIFHVFNNSFAGPLEVLYRFLEFFNSFDWDQFCVSLWGPIPISSLPDVTPDPPRKDCGELLLTRGFLDKCNAAYADLSTGQENQGQPFISKHFNIIDPLRINNNLGRSVSKGNFFRIRSAFAFGAKTLATLLYCPQEDIVFELNQFFFNTWERHGRGIRPDALTHNFQHLMPLNVDQSQGFNIHMSMSSKKKKNERSFGHESIVEGMNNTYTYYVENSNHPSKSTAAKNVVSLVSRSQTQKGYANQIISARISDQSEKGVSNQGTRVDRSQRSLKLDKNVNEYIQGKYLFARTRSSPELTETYTDTSSQGRPNKAVESAENQVAPTKADNSRGIWASGHGNLSEERAFVVGAQGMLQEEQDLVNMISSSVNNSENPAGQVNENRDSAEITLADDDSEFWHERDGSSSGRFVHDDGNMVWFTFDDKQPSTSGSSGSVQPCRHHSGSSRHQPKSAKENGGSVGGDEHQDVRMNDVYHHDRHHSASQASSLRSKSSSEGSWDGSSSKASKSTASTTPSTVYGKGKHVSEHASIDAEDESGDWNPAATTEMAERRSTSYLCYHARAGHGDYANIYYKSRPFLSHKSDSGSCQRVSDGSRSLPLTFYPTGPPVPFVTMLPSYNFPSDARSPDAQLGSSREEGLNNTVTNTTILQGIESCDGIDALKAFNASSLTERASPEEPRDILNSDFLSHWQNLQYGRSCQNPRLVYPSPVIVPRWHGLGRPLETNMLSKIMSYSHRLVPIPPVHTVSDTPAGDYPRYVEDMPRYRAGTGTYLPNPKASRDRHSSGTRRNNYNYDRNDHRGDKDGNWNTSKSRAASRNNHNRNQADKSGSRLYRQTSKDSQAEHRPWNSHNHHESMPSYESQNGPLHLNSSQSSSANVAYGMYQVPGMDPNRVASNGPPVAPVVMFYSYDNSSGYGASPSELLELASIGPIGFVGSNEAAQHVMEGARARGIVEEHRFHASSQRSSFPDQPSSPHIQSRRT